MDPKKFFAELKRRNVYKMAAAYAGVAWVLFQAASIILPTYGAPAWTMKVVIAGLAIGFAIVVLLAWAFEFTPDGRFRSKEDAAQASITKRRGRKLNFVIISALLVAITLLVTERFWPRAGKGIAVLPFENLSRDPDNAIFADGVQEDIVTNLGKIADLKVIGRTSVMQYRPGTQRNLIEIGNAVGVDSILEGSVRRDEKRVVVNAQLSDARDGRQIWGDTFDGNLVDSLRVQGDLAKKIAGALKIKLAPALQASLTAEATTNPDAYVFYHRGRDYQMLPEVSQHNFLTAENFYKQAVMLDPAFALARARLSEMQHNLYAVFDRRPARLAEALSNAEEALRLDPDLGQAHMALAQCMQQANQNPEEIRREVATALRLLPNDGYLVLSAGILQYGMGWLKEAAATYERAIALNPREGKVFYNYTVLLYDQQDVTRARWASDRSLELSPDSVFFRLFRAKAEIEWTSDVAQGKKVLDGLPAGKDPDGRVTAARCSIAVWERNFAEALRILAACPRDRIPNLDMGFGPMMPKSFVQGLVQFYAGDREAAYATLDSGRWMLELDASQNPGDSDAHFYVALAYVGMGWKDAAKAVAARAGENIDDYRMAVLFALLGEADPALSALERAASKSDFKRVYLRLEPEWDSVRTEPRFQKLLANNVSAANAK